MKAKFATVNNRQLELDIPFEDFLCSGVMRRQALLNMCEPADVISDYLSPGTDLDDPMELRESFAEACELATEHALSSVVFDENDILFIRTQFGGYRPPPCAQAMRLAA